MKTTCAVCQSEIPEKAIKCAICGSFQSSWRRLLFGGQAAALASLIPVLALAFAFVSTQFKAVGSDVSIFEPDCRNPSAVTLTASNLGDRSAVLEPVFLKAVRPNTKDFLYEELQAIDHPTGHVLLPAGEITSFQIKNSKGPKFIKVGKDDECKYVIGYNIIEFNAKAEPKDIECDCAGVKKSST